MSDSRISKILDSLTEISEFCKANLGRCVYCPFNYTGGCLVQNQPSEWDIEEIEYIFEVTNNDGDEEEEWG